MKKLKQTLLIFFLCCFHNFMIGQSTSNWIKVKSTTDSNFNYPITKNGSYVSIKIVGERIYHNSNWWTNLISKNRQAFVTIGVKADYTNNKSLEDNRSSKMIKIEQKQQPIDLGWSQYIVREIPSTFNSVKLNLTLSSTSEDGADKVISIASDISSKIPALSVAQSYLGVISGAKLLLDEVFSKNLAKTYLNSNNEIISAAQNNISPGFYVIFGENTSTAYQTYVDNSFDLQWDGVQLKYKNAPITNLNYFIIVIEAKARLFPTKNIDILSDIETPWAKFYIQANQKITSMQLADLDQTKTKVRELLESAKMVLDNDVNYIFSEKDEIHDAIRKYLYERYDTRKKELEAGTTFHPK